MLWARRGWGAVAGDMETKLEKNKFRLITRLLFPCWYPTVVTVIACIYFASRAGVDARPEGRAFEFQPIRDVRLCSWAKHFTTNCPCLIG